MAHLAPVVPQGIGSGQAAELAAKVEAFVRGVVIPYEKDTRFDNHGHPTEDLVEELKQRAREAGVLSPHILADGSLLVRKAQHLAPNADEMHLVGGEHRRNAGAAAFEQVDPVLQVSRNTGLGKRSSKLGPARCLGWNWKN